MRSDSPCHCMPRPNSAVGAADDAVGRQEQGRPDRVGERRHQRRPAAEAGQRVLLDRQRVQPGAEAVRLPLPLGLAGELRGEVRLPEGDVADPADAEHRHQLRPLLLQVGDLLGVGRQLAS